MIDNTYKASGVDISAANEMKASFSPFLERSGTTLNRRNAFAAIFDANLSAYRDPVLVFKSEEPGSKQLLALERDRVESVCTDMINHLVNDCIVCGATPVAIQDVIVCGKLDPSLVKRAVKAMAQAAAAHGCFLSGGETSEQPGVLGDGVYVLSSSIIGVVERDGILDGSTIEPGDVVLALRSSGIHTNGYSLVRHLISRHPELLNTLVDGRPFGEVILDVHRSYLGCLKPLFERSLVKGAAHITGGGIGENLNRILPDSVDALISLQSYKPNPIFQLLREVSGLHDQELLRTFNLGVGMAIVVAEENLLEVSGILDQFEMECWPIGRTQHGTGVVRYDGTIPWGSK
ncbi:phosphoribosylformylglycinamidine cyclo-ligase [Rhizobium rhizogenes]|uniref:phosphoribosylformylglycinamidine cyclo-ligase n=1 Tax=Rhizobium rhizogenes TaxID=359 RepID=UPI001573B539|nr:phosphoribosylformylglycinamidine cyclo-ligase [Rhizobium rhizogenes]NTI76600.1 phosphoribosylformylglycinamidine cyclo-ligase [Rhizobium rhizogenes]